MSEVQQFSDYQEFGRRVNGGFQYVKPIDGRHPNPAFDIALGRIELLS